MTEITEIAPDLNRISTYVPEVDLQFNQFVVRDEEPLLYHTGMKGLFPAVRDAVARVLDPTTIRWNVRRCLNAAIVRNTGAGCSRLPLPERAARIRGFLRSRGSAWP